MAADFRNLVADPEHLEIEHREEARRAAAAGRRQRVNELIEHHVSDENWRVLLYRAREAAEHSQNEFMLFRFPNQICSDGGRAINVAGPDWPATLRGEGAGIYLRWERDLRARGFHLAARVLEFPGGMPDDIGLFLIWGECGGVAIIDLDQSGRDGPWVEFDPAKSRAPAMADTLTPRFLDRRSIDKAYPLVRNTMPGMTVDRWARFVRSQLAPRSPDWPRGMMTIQNAAGYILALFAFEVRYDLHENRIFYMDHIMIPNLPGRGTIWASAIDSAEQLAKMNGCRAIRAELGGDLECSDEDLLISLERSGYSSAGVRAFKRLDAGSSSADGDSSGTVARSPQGIYHA